MLRFTLITAFGRPEAIICDDPPAPGQRSVLFGLLPEASFDPPTLARRWAVPAVLCTPDWRDAQMARVPMLRPTGHRLAIITQDPA
jgi:hypothetical protein